MKLQPGMGDVWGEIFTLSHIQLPNNTP